MESEHFGIFNIFRGSFASPSGRTHFRKMTQNGFSKQKIDGDQAYKEIGPIIEK